MILLSDLHIGAGDAADDFGPANGSADAELVQQIRRWEVRGERIALLGDIFELWQTDLGSILRAHQRVVWELFSQAEFYVVGNHDSDLLGECIFGVEAGLYETRGDCFFEHGDVHDDTLKRFEPLARCVSWIVGHVERVLDRDADLWSERAAGWVLGVGRWGSSARYAPRVAETAYEHGCNRAFFGHTHDLMPPRMIEPWGVEVGNSGCYQPMNGKRDWLRFKEQN